MYGAFGVLISSTGTTSNSYRYTAREFDQDTGLYYYRARYYDPGVGRFISEDPLEFNGDGPNFYMYAFNAPLQWRDPDGKSVDWGGLWDSWKKTNRKLAWLNCLAHGGYCLKTLPETSQGIGQMSTDAILNTAIANQQQGNSSGSLSNQNLKLGLCENKNCAEALEDCARQALFGVSPIQPPNWLRNWPPKWLPWVK